jgi:prepilin-type N-terminal cleavage/methylation domain-containing protein
MVGPDPPNGALMKSKRNRRGFTLGEMLVTVAIIAVIAAVVIPSIGSQLTKGDESRVQQDLLGIRGAIEQFLADVRRYPATVAQLIRRPTTVATDSALAGTGGAYTTAQANRWRGPYLSKDSVAALTTGFGGTITFIRDSIGAATGAQNFLVIKVSAIDSASAVKVDVDMDDGVSTTGTIRLITGSILKYFAIPIQ